MKFDHALIIGLLVSGTGAGCQETTAPEPGPRAAADAVAGRGLAVYGPERLVRAVPVPCPANGTRDFDFWLGSWNIESGGAVVATSVITSELDGCVVMEDFINANGAQARSMSAFDAATGIWHQAYQDNLLGNYRLSGSTVPDGMELSGGQEIFHFGLGTFVHREATSTWHDNGDGTVSQTILGSFDGGPTQTLFSGIYRPTFPLDRATPAFFPICQFVLPGFRELDFWIGSWTVAAAAHSVGTSHVAADLNGCLLQEDFQGRNGYRSRSFLFWDFAENRWFRTMADNTGGWVQLSGGLDNGRMVLVGTDEGPDRRTFQVRNTLDPTSTGVTETWEISQDDGATWKLATELVYTH